VPVRLSLALLVLALAGCDGATERASGGAEAAARPPAEAAAPDAAPIARDSDAQATDPAFETALAPVHDVEIRARAGGEVMALEVDEGARVKAGALLAKLDDRERHATLAEREASLARLESAWRRAQQLHEQGVIADEAFVAARADWQMAIAQRDRAKLEWERCAVRSPIAGVVALRRIQRGQMVAEGDLLFRVSDPDLLRAELLLPEKHFGSVRAGQPVTLVPVAGGSGTPARVTRVSPLVDPASGTFRVTIDVDNRRLKLPAGITVRVALEPVVARK